MKEPDNIHWTRDADLVERFVLHQIEGAHYAELAEHLTTCASCREIVQKEQTLVAGIRRYGRTRLKDRLANRIGSAVAAGTSQSPPPIPGRKPVRHFPWARVTSAAAILVVALGIGIYYRWLGTEKTPEIASTTNAERENAPSPQVRDQLAGKEAPVRSERAPEQVHGHIEAGEKDDIRITGGYAQDEKQVKKPLDIVGRDREEEKKAKTEFRVDASVAEGLWIDGSIISGAEDRNARLPASESDSRNELRQKDLGYAAKALEKNQANVQSNIQLTQQPLNTLPGVQQNKQDVIGTRKVQTLFQQTPQGLHLTIFSDRTFSTSDLQNATVEQVAPESLVVNVARDKIGYRVPAGLNAVQGAQGETKK